MRRRDFTKGIVGSAVGWPLVERAQQPAIPVIGMLDSRSLDAITDRLRAFRRGPSENGFVEGSYKAARPRCGITAETIHRNTPQGIYTRLGSEIGVPAMKIVKLIAALLIGFFLSFQHSALAQSAKEASQLNNLAVELFNSGRYSEAEPIFKRALAIREKTIGPNHPDVAATLSYLASLYHKQGRYADAEPLFKRSLAIQEKVLGPDHPNVATYLNNLAALYYDQGRYADAEPLYKRSLAIREKVLGPDHPSVATSLNNLAELYENQGRYADAEPLFNRSLAIQEKVLGPDHPSVAASLNNLAELYHDQGRYADALPIVQRTIAQKKVVKSVAFGVI